MRFAVLALAGLETLVFLVLVGAAWMEDPAEIRIVGGLARLASIPFLFGTAPALVLAILNRHIRLAGLLALAVAILVAVAFPHL